MTPQFHPSLPPAGSRQLVGRQAVLDILAGLVNRLQDGVSDIGVVTGPMGSGRSAVLERTVDRARASGPAVGVAPCLGRRRCACPRL